MLWHDEIIQALLARNIAREGLARHEADTQKQFAALCPVIRGRTVRSILDIGSGLAALDVLIVQAFPSIETVHLIDGDRLEQSRGGYFPAGRPWADVHMGVSMVRENCPGVRVVPHVVPARPTETVDIILSARSWGHHYPVGEYVDLAAQILAPGGVIIMDIRNGTSGVSEMRDGGFRPCGLVPDASTKCRRIAFERVPL